MADEQGELNNNSDTNNNDRMSRPDSCENLDLSFDDLYIEDLLDVNNSSDPTDIQKPSKLSASSSTATCGTAEDQDEAEDYILGTLIVRVVAARDLQSAGPVGGIGKFLFGNNHHHHTSPNRQYHRSSSSGGSGGGSHNRSSTNPYASVRFGRTTQRTSQVYGTVDPIWPRGESMYMDVVHPRSSRESSCQSSDNDDNNNNNNNVSTTITSKQKSGTVVASNSSWKKADLSDFSKKPCSSHSSNNNNSSSSSRQPYSKPILTVAIFHANNDAFAKQPKYPTTKKGAAGAAGGDSDDQFLGMTAVDLTCLLTGKLQVFDEWLPLSGSSSNRATVRIVCEYEAADAAPCPGDWVRFTHFCHPADLYPLYPDRLYRVEEDNDDDNNNYECGRHHHRHGDNVLISYTSPEGWVSTVLVHRNMLFCEERHQRAGGVVELYQDELASLQHKITHSPMVHVVQETMQRLPDEGLMGVGVDAVRGGASLLTRWIEGGIGTAVNDVVFATNWDGRFNPDAATTLSTTSFDDENEEQDDEDHTNAGEQQQQERQDAMLYSDLADTEDELYPDIEPLPNMPHCPITGEPMRNPVVAADGHTYERTAIARWLKTSDKSPLTGSILPHKNLVPNYMLLSSLSEVAVTTTSTVATTATAKPPPPSSLEEEDDDVTAEVKIDD